MFKSDPTFHNTKTLAFRCSEHIGGALDTFCTSIRRNANPQRGIPTTEQLWHKKTVRCLVFMVRYATSVRTSECHTWICMRLMAAGHKTWAPVKAATGCSYFIPRFGQKPAFFSGLFARRRWESRESMVLAAIWCFSICACYGFCLCAVAVLNCQWCRVLGFLPGFEDCVLHVFIFFFLNIIY